MAGITLEQAQSQLAIWLEADAKVATGQMYQIADRRLTRADAAEITNKIERRYCPVQNQCEPHCEKAKEWRKDFLPYDHSIKEMKEYYKKFPVEEK